ncbi:MAG TPA: SRPBCC family protein [Acidimicrobiales bacterium]|nr:SRPBCC family protein [Acidimicrobiales bacterium]
MDFSASAPLTAAPDRVFVELADLGSYPEWLGLVHDAEPTATHDEDPGPAWWVDLGIVIGPFKKTKRVRMVRTELVTPKMARFERMEHDEGKHPAWILTAEVQVTEKGSLFTMDLHYGGNLNFPGVEALLGEEVRRAGKRLEERLNAASGA